MEILKRLSLLSVLFLYTVQSHAQPPVPVTHVYRMDTRHPDTIFRSAGGGFAPRGTNDDITEHVQEVIFKEKRLRLQYLLQRVPTEIGQLNGAFISRMETKKNSTFMISDQPPIFIV